jgi:redox-sensitive bicupin YhaK (pirin superfamily)
MTTKLDGITIQRSSERARYDHGWLQTSHSFSFASYLDPENLNWGALRVFNEMSCKRAKGSARTRIGIWKF